MRASVFNYVVDAIDANPILYNVLNDSFVSLEAKEHKCFQTGLINELSEECIAELYENGFLVDDNVDEREFLKYQFERTRYATDTFAITIAPTLNCNFACAYCYETPRHGDMTDRDFALVLDFIHENYERSPFKKLQVNWYGGEPMLCIEKIAGWSKSLFGFSDDRNIEYTSHMITNGSLVTEENVHLLNESRIGNVQVTIDGWRNEHDKRRPARDGKPKFDSIVLAVELMAKAGIEVSCRMNADANNVEDYRKLADFFKDTRNVYVHVGHLRDYQELPEETYRCFDCKGFSEIEFEIFKDSGYTIEDLSNIFSKRRMFCGACTENSYVIDEQCNVYKCWNDIGDDERVVFNLHVPKEERRVDYEALCRYMTWNPFDDDACGTCIWMPICGGGCVFEKDKLGKAFCYPPVYTVDKYLNLYLKEVCGDESDQKS